MTNRYLIPDALAPLAVYKQFILVQFVPRIGALGKTDKHPINPATFKRHDAHDPTIWLDVSAASTLATKMGAGWGIGFVITETDPFICLDLDDCLKSDGITWADSALEMLAQFPGACEVSNSGRGLHVWATYKGATPAHGKRNTMRNMELYSSKRFIALGGAANGAIQDVTAILPGFIDSWFKPNASENENSGVWTSGPTADYSPLTDDELLNKALSRSRPQDAGTVFGNDRPLAAFAHLWTRDLSILSIAFPPQSVGKDIDASSADFALAKELAYWTGKDCERIKCLMQMSALKRDKWKFEIHRHYLRDTILAGVAACKTVYQDKPHMSAMDAWSMPTPLPNALPAVLPFSPDLLPQALRTWVMDISNRMQCPPDFPAVGAIVALSSLIGARAVIQPKARDDWQVVPNLWGLIVGRPGVMKSPALGEVLKC